MSFLPSWVVGTTAWSSPDGNAAHWEGERQGRTCNLGAGSQRRPGPEVPTTARAAVSSEGKVPTP